MERHDNRAELENHYCKIAVLDRVTQCRKSRESYLSYNQCAMGKRNIGKEEKWKKDLTLGV